MRYLLKAFAGVVIAASAALASAQPVTLDFDDLVVAPIPPNPNGGPLTVYKGFNFDNSTGTLDPNTALPGTWFWQTASGPFSGSPTPLANATGYFSLPLPVPPELHAFSFRHDGGMPFTLQSLWVCCGPVYLELVGAGGGPISYLGWDGVSAYDPGGISPHPVTGDPVAGVVTLSALLSSMPLDEVAIWSFPNQFAVDDIKVTVVPEPGAYALALAGLGVLVAARRRRNSKSA